MAKKRTIPQITAYISLIIAPNGHERKGIKRHKSTAATDTVKKTLTAGVTATEAIIPTGMNIPKRLMLTGIVAVWAPTEAERESAIGTGRNHLTKQDKQSAARSIPASAPYESIKAAECTSDGTATVWTRKDAPRTLP